MQSMLVVSFLIYTYFTGIWMWASQWTLIFIPRKILMCCTFCLKTFWVSPFGFSSMGQLCLLEQIITMLIAHHNLVGQRRAWAPWAALFGRYWRADSMIQRTCEYYGLAEKNVRDSVWKHFVAIRLSSVTGLSRLILLGEENHSIALQTT